MIACLSGRKQQQNINKKPRRRATKRKAAPLQPTRLSRLKEEKKEKEQHFHREMNGRLKILDSQKCQYLSTRVEELEQKDRKRVQDLEVLKQTNRELSNKNEMLTNENNELKKLNQALSDDVKWHKQTMQMWMQTTRSNQDTGDFPNRSGIPKRPDP